MEVVLEVVVEVGHEGLLTDTELPNHQCVGTSHSRNARLFPDSPVGQSLSRSAGNITASW